MPKKAPSAARKVIDATMPASWADLTASAIKLGAATVIGLFLVYYLTQTVEKKLDTLAVAMSGVADKVRDNGALFQVAQRICLNTAKTDQDRLACVVIHKD